MTSLIIQLLSSNHTQCLFSSLLKRLIEKKEKAQTDEQYPNLTKATWERLIARKRTCASR